MTIRRNIPAFLSLLALADPLPAWADCATPRDVAALKIASLQQRLMVAGLACHAAEDYNRFVLSNRPQLQKSDADLKDYFIHRGGGEANYDAYKTRLANLAAQAPATDQNHFCTSAAAEFAALARAPDGLMPISATETVRDAVCEAPVLTAAAPRPAPLQIAMADQLSGPAASALPAMPYGAAPPPTPVHADEHSAAYWYYRRLYARTNAYYR